MVVGDCTMTYKELVYTLIAKRKKYKVDRMVLAQIIGVADSLVGQWETFKKIPNAMTLIDWCDALDVELQLRDAQTECPKDFRASEKVIAWAYEQDIDYDKEREKFVDYYTAKGIKAKDWTSMFRLWLRRAIEFRAESKGSYQSYDKTSASFVRDRRKRILSLSNVSSKFLERKSRDE